MRVLLTVLQKEFRQIFRDPIILAMLTVMPTGQLLLLPLAANYEVKNINVAVVDHDRSQESRQIQDQLASSRYFNMVWNGTTMEQAISLVERNEADVVLEFPRYFERDAVRTKHPKLFLAVNAVNGVKANLGAAYLQTIVASRTTAEPSPTIELRARQWFNIHQDYRTYMVPGILALLVAMIAVYWSALNVVREIEVGTIEQINVTPIAKWQFILGKLLPFLILALAFFTVGLVLARLLYGIEPVGSLFLLYLFTTVCIIAMLGLGLLISVLSRTQQQAMFVSFFFMLIFIMMSGLFTPIASMPEWAQVVTYANPLRYLIDVMRLIVLKGSGFSDITVHFAAIIVIAILTNTAAVLSYRKAA